jgi:hypothetical protein
MFMKRPTMLTTTMAASPSSKAYFKFKADLKKNSYYLCCTERDMIMWIFNNKESIE